MKQLHVVTGANRGIGYEIVRNLVHRGDRVIATARRPDEAEALKELGSRVEALDVSDPRSVAAFAERLEGKPIDVLVNNAGIGVDHAPFPELDWSEVTEFFAVNAVGPMRVTQALLPNLVRGATKKVFNMTSRMGSIEDNTSGGCYGYRASKTALNMMTRSLAIDLKQAGFTCVVFHPGWVRTAMGGNSAPVEPEDSARALVELMDRLGPSESGRFFDFQGEPLPW